jgi:hypothetical protein
VFLGLPRPTAGCRRSRDRLEYRSSDSLFVCSDQAENYATGGPEGRYKDKIAMAIWLSLVAGMAATTSTALGVAGII